MIKMGRILTFILIFSCFIIVSAAAQETVWTRAALQNIYMDHLRTEGYVPSVDIDGDIQFKVSGSSYFIIIDENDLQFFQVYTGFILSAAPIEDIAVAVNFSNRRSKVAKISLSPDGRIASITAELLLNDPRSFAPVFSRALSLMRTAENNFLTHLRELTGG